MGWWRFGRPAVFGGLICRPPRPSKNVPSLYLLRQLALLELDSPTLLHIQFQLSLAASHAVRFITNVIPISHQSARFVAFLT